MECKCCKTEVSNLGAEHEDLITPIANVVMTPFSVITGACLQVILTSNAADDKALAFNLASASIIATGGMLMAVYLVTVKSCSSSKPGANSEPASLTQCTSSGEKRGIIEKWLLINPAPIPDKERLRVARMMLRCLWFSLSYMTTGLLFRVLKNQLMVRNRVGISVAISVWIVFIWSCFGAPLPRFNVWLRRAGSVLTTTFPLALMAAYVALCALS